jgi:hypothetical protein
VRAEDLLVNDCRAKISKWTVDSRRVSKQYEMNTKVRDWNGERYAPAFYTQSLFGTYIGKLLKQSQKVFHNLTL